VLPFGVVVEFVHVLVCLDVKYVLDPAVKKLLTPPADAGALVSAVRLLVCHGPLAPARYISWTRLSDPRENTC